MIEDESSYNRRAEKIFCVPKHVCASGNFKHERNHFCRVCGIFMPYYGDFSHKRQFYRSNEYSTQDPTKSNSNAIVTLLIKKQSSNRYYNANAPNLQNRGSLIEWMRALCNTLNYSENTAYLAVSYLDAVLSLYVIKESQLKLIGYVSVYVAAKMEEEDAKIPLIDEAVKLFKNEFTKADFVNCEMFLFRVLNYNLNIKTPYTFLCFFFSKGIVSDRDFGSSTLNSLEIERVVKQVEQLALLFLDLSLKYYDFYQFSAIAIATSALACARRCMNLPIWIDDLEKLTWVPWDSIKDSTALLFHLLKDAHPDIYAQFFATTEPDNSRHATHLTPQKKHKQCYEIAEEATKDRGSIDEDMTQEHSADFDTDKSMKGQRVKSFIFSSSNFEEKQSVSGNEFRICDELSYQGNEELDLKPSFSSIAISNSFNTAHVKEDPSYRICDNRGSEVHFA